MGGKTKSGGTKGKNDNNRVTLQIAAGNCWHEREARLLFKSACVLVHRQGQIEERSKFLRSGVGEIDNQERRVD